MPPKQGAIPPPPRPLRWGLLGNVQVLSTEALTESGPPERVYSVAADPARIKGSLLAYLRHPSSLMRWVLVNHDVVSEK